MRSLRLIPITNPHAEIVAQQASGKILAINWPTRWYPSYITAKRLIDQGAIGEVVEFHHYGGNLGPLFHRADKVESVPIPEEKAASWFYKKNLGGGSLLDYAGYGAYSTYRTYPNGHHFSQTRHP